ncbi:MAG: TolC family protein [Deltaproteobacteria bacterium]|nr:TolC family protein [Deltaproteobacteria bacterium]
MNSVRILGRFPVAPVAAALCLSFSLCPLPGAWGGDGAVPVSERAPGRPGAARILEGIERPAAASAVGAEGPVAISVEGAILCALENNRSLKVERLNPQIQMTQEEEEEAAFDPVLSGNVSLSREKDQERSRGSGTYDNRNNEREVGLGLSRFLPTGTEVSLDASTDRTWSDLYSNRHGTRVGLSVTQALLRGMGSGVNLATLRQARLDTIVSRYELLGFAESLVARVESTYWDYALARRRIEIFEESLALAEDQLRDTREMIEVGKLPEKEITAAEAEIALRRQGLINARSTLETTRLRLLRLLSPPGPDPWEREIVLRDLPAVPDVMQDRVEGHVEVALEQRPELHQARFQIDRDELEIVKTKNGLLPKMDLFISLGETGYADSFGGTLRESDGEYYDMAVGITLAYPLGNREARARHRRALIRREQAEEALANLAQLVEVDVRSAFIEVERTREQIEATRASRVLQDEKLQIESEKFRVGRSTMFLVAQAQRDLLSSRIAEVEVVVDYLKALVDLYRLEGSLLSRRGISAAE